MGYFPSIYNSKEATALHCVPVSCIWLQIIYKIAQNLPNSYWLLISKVYAVAKDFRTMVTGLFPAESKACGR